MHGFHCLVARTGSLSYSDHRDSSEVHLCGCIIGSRVDIYVYILCVQLACFPSFHANDKLTLSTVVELYLYECICLECSLCTDEHGAVKDLPETAQQVPNTASLVLLQDYRSDEYDSDSQSSPSNQSLEAASSDGSGAEQLEAPESHAPQSSEEGEVVNDKPVKNFPEEATVAPPSAPASPRQPELQEPGEARDMAAKELEDEDEDQAEAVIEEEQPSSSSEEESDNEPEASEGSLDADDSRQMKAASEQLSDDDSAAVEKVQHAPKGRQKRKAAAAALENVKGFIAEEGAPDAAVLVSFIQKLSPVQDLV